MKLKYVGKAWLPGIPARDLSDEEVKKHGAERLLKSGLYEKYPRKKKEKESDEWAE